MNTTLKIAVIGAGIGGLTAATLLAQQEHDVVIYDQFDTPQPVGSGLVIQPVGQEVLARIGALDAATQAGQHIGQIFGHEVENGRAVLNVSYAPRQGLAIHRASLFEILHRGAIQAGVQIIAGHKCTAITPPEIAFSTGTSGPYDLIIDASGAGSTLSGLRAKTLSYGALWGTVPWPEKTVVPKDKLRQAYRKANRMLGILPIGTVPGQSGPHAAIFWSLPSSGYTKWRETPWQNGRRKPSDFGRI